MLLVINILIIIVFLYACFRNLAYGGAILVSVKYLLPTINRLGNISLNTALVLIFFVFVIVSLVGRKKRIIYKASFIPVLYLFIPFMLINLFSVLDYRYSYGSLIQFFITEILPYVLILCSINDEKSLSIYVRALTFSFLLIGFYSLICYFIKVNPLCILYSASYGGDVYIDFTDGDATRGIFDSRTTGNQVGGAIPWGQISLSFLAFVILFPDLEKYLKNPLINSHILRYLIIIVSLLNCFFTTKRSIIAPVIFLLFSYALSQKLYTFKNIMKFVSGIFFAIVLITFVPTLNQFYESNLKTSVFFWDDSLANKRDISGSDASMRVSQASYINNLISDHLLTGLGSGYIAVHTEKYGSSSDALFFESLYFQAIAEYGYIGFFVWFIFFYKMYYATRRKKSKFYSLALNGSYFLSAMMTGIMVSFSYYLIICAMFISSKRIKLKK